MCLFRQYLVAPEFSRKQKTYVQTSVLPADDLKILCQPKFKRINRVWRTQQKMVVYGGSYQGLSRYHFGL